MKRPAAGCRNSCVISRWHIWVLRRTSFEAAIPAEEDIEADAEEEYDVDCATLNAETVLLLDCERSRH